MRRQSSVGVKRDEKLSLMVGLLPDLRARRPRSQCSVEVGHWALNFGRHLMLALTVDRLTRGYGNVLYRWRFLFWLGEKFHEAVDVRRHVG